MARPEPETAEAQELQRVVTPERWGQLVEQGQARAAVVERVQEEREATGVSWRRCLAAVAADVDWSTYLHWRRRYHARGGPAWERLLDERVPPRQEPIPEDIRMAACLLRRQDRGINCSRARELLVQVSHDTPVNDDIHRQVEDRAQ